jgi:hypothetical protein
MLVILAGVAVIPIEPGDPVQVNHNSRVPIT